MRGATGVEKINKKKRVKIEIIGGEVETWLHEVPSLKLWVIRASHGF